MSKVMRLWRKHRVLSLLLVLSIVFSLTVGASIGKYILSNPDDSVQQNVAAWARNNHLGFVVDKLEEWLKGTPPSMKAAEELTLAIDDKSIGDDEVSSTTVVAQEIPTPTNKVITDRTLPTAVPPVVLPALVGEGEWVNFAELKGKSIAFATSFRPFADFASVVASAVVFDQSQLVAGLFNGHELPGGSWNNGNRVMKPAVPSLVMAFNGGFRFEHHKGGYFTEGKMLKPLRPEQATLAIDHNGFVTLGVFGRDIFDDGTWKTLRQNLPPVMIDGEIALDKFRGTHWGDDFGKVIYTFRSALCLRLDGRLMFTAAGDVDIRMFADILKMLKCKTAMQLDINGTWPQIARYEGFGTTTRQGVLLDKRMNNANRYLNKSSKDFVALFDPATLPPEVLR